MNSDASASEPRFFNLALLGIVLLALIPRLIFGASQYIEYDGYWHVWIAQQDRWANFVREYHANAHPPLYFLLLRWTAWLGKTNLAYRFISIASGTASVFLLGRTAMRALRSPVWAVLAALAYGLALPSLLLSNEVRTYMLSAFFVQLSFLYFLDLTVSGKPAHLKSRVIFAVAAVLACLTEYYALIYVGAALLVALIAPFLNREKKPLHAVLRELATFLLILALPVREYLRHFGARSVSYDHLPTYYFQPDGAESAIGFLLRNLRNELNWFSPVEIPEGTAFYAVLCLLIVAAAAIVILVRRWSDPKNAAAITILIFSVSMLGAIMLGALLRAYPFGGFLRQQFILFPFLVICPFLIPDRLLTGTPRLAVAGVLAAGILFASYRNYDDWPKSTTLLLSDQMGRYNRLFPDAESIYIDQYNLITFFMHHHDWKWEFLAPLPDSATVDVYKLTSGNRSMILFRDRDHWNLDLRDPLLYKQMAAGLRAWHLSSATIFGLAQPVGKTRTGAQVTAYRARAAELSAAEGLCVQKLDLDNYDVYAKFRLAGSCTTP